MKKAIKVAALIDSDVSRKVFRKNWARLIQKIYPLNFPEGTLLNRENNVDPLICPKCQGKIRI